MNYSTKELLFLAIKASLKASEKIMKIYTTEFTVEKKNDNSPLTQADKASHEIIEADLIKTGIPVLSEEGKNIPYMKRKQWKKLWIVDPLDGTKEFVKRNGEFTVNIALIQEGIPVIGVIHAPVLKTLYFSEKDLGAWKTDDIENGENISGIDTILVKSSQLPVSNPERPYTIVASRSHMNKETKAFIHKLEAEKGHIETISRGSSLKLCQVAEGAADIYPRFGPTMEWDTAAGQAIVMHSGGSVIRTKDQTILQYNREDLLNPWFIAERKP